MEARSSEVQYQPGQIKCLRLALAICNPMIKKKKKDRMRKRERQTQSLTTAAKAFRLDAHSRYGLSDMCVQGLTLGTDVPHFHLAVFLSAVLEMNSGPHMHARKSHH